MPIEKHEARLLTQYGIEFREIPRLKKHGKEISASSVRSLLTKKDFSKIKELVPQKTLNYLKEYTKTANL